MNIPDCRHPEKFPGRIKILNRGRSENLLIPNGLVDLTAGMQIPALGQGDKPLGNPTDGLGLGVGGLDFLAQEKRGGHVPKERLAMRRSPIQGPTSMTMSHGFAPFAPNTSWVRGDKR